MKSSRPDGWMDRWERPLRSARVGSAWVGSFIYEARRDWYALCYSFFFCIFAQMHHVFDSISIIHVSL